MENVKKDSAEKPVKAQKPSPIKQHEINLVAALNAAKQNDKRAQKSGRPGALVYVLAAFAVLGMAGAYAGFYLQREELAYENEELEMSIFMQQDTLLEAEQQRLKKDYLTKLENSTREELSPLSEALSQYGYYEADIFDKIKGCFDGKINLESFEMKNGLITLELTASEPLDCAQYVQRLRKTEMFDVIEYSGFDAGMEDGSASYQITCHLAGSPVEGGVD